MAVELDRSVVDALDALEAFEKIDDVDADIELRVCEDTGDVVDNALATAAAGAASGSVPPTRTLNA